MPQVIELGEEVVFTYDVMFKMSDIRWASRWDTYLQMMDDQIHWFSIINSLMILLFLSGMVAMIMGRGSHSSTFRFHVSAFFGIGGAFLGCAGDVYELSGGIRGCLGCYLCQNRLKVS